eukprot:gnl/TRDRNA2_/TRDRNA2_195312_c0_seq1.p1 gnl/TRDRNA2_/TRDRNA2_195312_c0~~gnl/TRDRNA2_/TRDRNA2_195312_c0_seq1.p1  ORF type:complete len:601 (-),score=128.35 gnl/TRDRNA2_/TRDRNA2_195312_c0_seq1:66-1817(-)
MAGEVGGLFVQRTAQPAPRRDAAAARRMVQELAEIVIDESPHADFLTPDERRLQGAAGRRQDFTDDEENGSAWSLPDEPEDLGAPNNQAGIGRAAFAPPPDPVVDGLFARRKNDGGEAPAAPGGGGEADTLFARRPPAGQPAAASPPTQVDALFMSRKAAAPAQREGGEAQDIASDDEVEDVEDAPASARSGGRRWACSCGKLTMPALPSELPGTKTLAVALGIVGLLAFLTIALWMGCDENPPLGRFCVAEEFQSIVAILPSTLLFSGGGYWHWRKYTAERQQKESAYQHDGDAQASAMNVLEALTTAPADDRHKYAGQVVQIMKDFPAKAVIQQKGCAAIEAICRAKRGNAVHAQAAGVVPVLLNALEKHLRVRPVQQSGLGALACVAKVARNQVFDLGGIGVILRSMNKFKRDSAVQVSGAMALGALCLNSTQCRRSVAKYGGLTMLLQALERHVDRADVLIAASETMALISQGDSGLRKQLTAALPVVQGIIGRYEREAESGKQGRANRARDSEVVLRSLRKLEARLCELTGNTGQDDDEMSEAGTPRGAQAVQQAFNAQVANTIDLQKKLNMWNQRKK